MAQASDHETIIYRKDDGIAEIRLNRPHRMNAVIEQLYMDVLEALDDAEADTAIRVVILTGEGMGTGGTAMGAWAFTRDLRFFIFFLATLRRFRRSRPSVSFFCS